MQEIDCGIISLKKMAKLKQEKVVKTRTGHDQIIKII